MATYTVTLGSRAGVTYPGTQDVSLNSATPAVNNSTGIYLTSTSPDAFLIRFPGLSNIPANATITAATLSLVAYNGGGGPTLQSAFVCTRAWTNAGATYNTYNGATAWATSGATGVGDRQAAASDSATAAIFENLNFSSAGIVAAVQAWTNNTVVNNGFWVGKTADVGYANYLSSEDSTVATRPLLTVTYDVPNPPSPQGWKKYIVNAGTFVKNAISLAVADIGGWKTYTPVAKDANPMNSFALQTGSRIYYVDPSKAALANIAADIADGDYYGWNGTNIIDSSGSTTGAGAVAYGSDYKNPTGPIKTYRRVSYCLLDRFGNNRVNGGIQNGDSTSVGAERFNNGAGRVARPDKIMIRRNRTIALESDFYGTCLEGNPALLKQNMLGTLNMPPGSALSAMSTMEAYGPPADPRPVFTEAPVSGFITATGIDQRPEYRAYVSIVLDGYSRAHYFNALAARPALNVLYSAGIAGNKNFWFEDCGIYGTDGIVSQLNSNLNIDFFRSLLLDTYGNRVSGVFTANTGLSSVNWYDSIIGRNGKTNNPMLPGGGTDAIYDRNFYYGGEADCVQQTLTNCIILPGGSADQFRSGAKLVNNYFMGAAGLAGQNGKAFATAAINTGQVSYCIFERYYKNNQSHSAAGGVSVFYGAHDVDVANNIITDAGMKQADRVTVGATPGSGGMAVGGSPEGWYHPQLAPTQYVRQHNNVVINRAGSVSFAASEGVGAIEYMSNPWTHYVATSGAATWNDLGYTYSNTKPSPNGTTLAAAAIAGATAVTLTSATFGSDPLTKIGWNIGVLMTNAATHWTTMAAGTSGVNVVLTAPLPVGAASGSNVVCAQPANYQYPATNANTFDLNLVIGQSNTNANAKVFNLFDGAPILPTDTRTDTTTYANNTHMTVAAAASAGYDIDRCMYTYCASVGLQPSSTFQDVVVDELIGYLKANQRKGQYNPIWTGKPAVNHVRAGLLLAAVP